MAPMADVALLVSGEWLKGKMAADDVTGLVIVDVSWSPTKDCLQEYKNCHIPGAHYLNVLNAEHTSRYPRNLPAEAVFTEMARNIGINSTSHVVVYSNSDNAGYFMSGRGWWTLKYFGHPNVSIMDGGLQKWTTLGYPLSSDVTPATTAGEFSAIGGHMYRSFEELSDNLESQEFQVCDARPPGQFSGNTENTGHIPGASNLPMDKVVDNNTGLLKTTDELQNLFLSTGIDLSQPVVTSCNRGMIACTVAFAAAVCGADNVAVYRTVFLPQGFPESVSSDYVVYQVWDTIQAFASSITGTLAAQAVLKGVGVGDESATVLAATITWLLKDGTGMLGRILFAWMQGTSLDCDAKRWRLFADIINDIAIFLEILAPNFPTMFTFTICCAGVLKSIVGVAGGATRAALTLHQARRNNMADVSAKDGSQETLVNLAGLLCSLMLVPVVTGKTMLIWTLYILFTTLHLYANYSAVTSVVMETLNQSRLHVLLQRYFLSGEVLPTNVVNYREPVVWKMRRKLEIQLGTSIQALCNSAESFQTLQNIYHSSQYMLWLDPQKGVVYIALGRESDIYTQLQACYQAELLEFVYSNRDNTRVLTKQLQDISAAMDEGAGHTIDMLQLSYAYMRQTFPEFVEDAHRQLWRTDISLLGADEWRSTFHLNN